MVLFESLFSLLLAILGLGFLIFIHELGHYWMARREGMKIEAFSIGFGRPIVSWVRDGVRWQISWIPFGGFVKIAGMQKEPGSEPHEISGGFFSKTPWQRIRVSFMGPAVNILFGLLLFSFLWMSGGRERQFAEFTRRIGWIDPQSDLYAKGVRPGDVIETYDGRPFGGIKDLTLASIMKGNQNRIQGYKIDPITGKRTDFDYTLDNYASREAAMQLKTIGVAAPASYLIYDEIQRPFVSGSPMASSGIQNGDRIFWADGETLYSHEHLVHAVNESTAFLTVRRGDLIFHAKVPRVHLDELQMTPMQQAELDDWQYEAKLGGRVQDLYFIPYLFSPSGLVEMRLEFIDEQDQKRAFEQCQRCSFFHPLEEGDQILAIDGQKVSSSYDLLHLLQQRRMVMIVQRGSLAPDSWKVSDADFEKLSDRQDLQKIVASIGLGDPVREAGRLVLLNAVEPKPLAELSAAYDRHKELLEKSRAQIEAIKDPAVRQETLERFSAEQKKMYLGIRFHDRPVIYNPSPLEQFANVFKDTWRTLSGLFSGSLSPKYMSGPVGIVQVVQYGWMQGVKEAVYWMGFISLNLGIVNLLPIPVLDGGHIVFSLYEAFTRRRISAKMMERLVLPFFGLIIAFFIYITYQDLSRIFSRFF